MQSSKMLLRWIDRRLVVLLPKTEVVDSFSWLCENRSLSLILPLISFFSSSYYSGYLHEEGVNQLQWSPLFVRACVSLCMPLIPLPV